MDITNIILAVATFMLALMCHKAILDIRDLRDKLAMARNMVNALAPKAKAWDDWLAGVKRPAPWCHLETAAGTKPRTDEFRVAYQHLSAECDGCEDKPAPPCGPYGGFLGGA